MKKCMGLVLSAFAWCLAGSGEAAEDLQITGKIEAIELKAERASFLISFKQMDEICPELGGYVVAPLRDDDVEKYMIQRLVEARNQDSEVSIKVRASGSDCLLVQVE